MNEYDCYTDDTGTDSEDEMEKQLIDWGIWKFVERLE
jgi:hypothetical protein